MRVLILGGGGFIGTSLTKRLLLQQDIELTSVSRTFLDKSEQPRRLTRVVTSDINARTVREHLDRCDVAIDLTTPNGAPRHPRDQLESGAREAVKFLEKRGEIIDLLCNFKRRLVGVGSGGTLYGLKLGQPAKEETPHNPSTPYSLNSALTVNLATFYRNNYGMDITCLLAANPYGPWQTGANGQGVIGTWINCLLNRRGIKVKGGLGAQRDYVYIDDFCELVYRVATTESMPEYVTYNAGTGNGTSLASILDTVLRHTQSDTMSHFSHTDYPSETQDCIALDASRARREFGWNPKTTIEEGIKTTVDWFKTHVQ